jgi:uncharacterized PurR-regulated membrane protein YhhQ (DUF165 family)
MNVVVMLAPRDGERPSGVPFPTGRAAVAWQFSARDYAVRKAREHTAPRVIAVSFFALAAFVTVSAPEPLFYTPTGGCRQENWPGA